MKREINLATATNNIEAFELVRNIKSWVKAPAEWLRLYYSEMLEEEVSSHKASLMTQTQLAFVFISIHHNRKFSIKSRICGMAIGLCMAAKEVSVIIYYAFYIT